MTSTGGGGGLNVGAVGEGAGVWLDDPDAYSIALVAATEKEVTEVNSVGGVTPLNAGGISGTAQASGSAGSVTLNKPGLYEISLSASFFASGGAKIDGAIYLNTVRRGEVTFERDIANPNQTGSIGPSHTIRIAEGDLPAVITARLISDATRTIGINHFSLHAVGAGT